MKKLNKEEAIQKAYTDIKKFKFLREIFEGPIELKAKELAIKAHTDIDHRYDNKSYIYHLMLVRHFADYYIDHLSPKDWDIVFAGCWLHDAIEDAHLTYNDIKKECGVEVAEIAYALTNEKGRNRSERASDKYYDEMRSIKYAPYIKICDRLANVFHSYQKANKGEKTPRMLKMYSKELKKFKASVGEFDGYYTSVFQKLLFKIKAWFLNTSHMRYMYLNSTMKMNFKYQDMWDELELMCNEKFK